MNGADAHMHGGDVLPFGGHRGQRRGDAVGLRRRREGRGGPGLLPGALGHRLLDARQQGPGHGRGRPGHRRDRRPHVLRPGRLFRLCGRRRVHSAVRSRGREDRRDIPQDPPRGEGGHGDDPRGPAPRVRDPPRERRGPDMLGGALPGGHRHVCAGRRRPGADALRVRPRGCEEAVLLGQGPPRPRL